jgi:protease IV
MTDPVTNMEVRDLKTHIEARRTASYAFLLLALTFMASGCLPTSFLITPVSGSRHLVETELSSDSFFASSKIALIDVSGTIQNGSVTKFLGAGDNPVSTLLEQLDKARKDGNVKAVILRINSPGGTVVASELMHDEIMYFKKKTGKPVIAVMMDVAASGGYYIACACDEIVAQKSTVTGSIGVIMQLVNVAGTLEMIGVKSDAITSGKHKDSGSPFRTMRPEERELFQGIINDMYERFLDVVEAGRPKLDEQTIRTLADGRVYTANQALENGLIDRIASLRTVIDDLKDQLDITNVRVVTYMRAHEYRPNYYAQAPVYSSNQVNLLNIDVKNTLTPSAPSFMYLWAPGAN